MSQTITPLSRSSSPSILSSRGSERLSEVQGVNESLLEPILLHFKPAALTDVPLASIPCPTCGRPSPSALSTDSLIVPLEPPPELPSFYNERDELVFLRNALPPLRQQFAREVTRVIQEVGMEGYVQAQALVLDVEGTWREVTGVVNKLAANLTN
ncbi:hypothetical protein H0H92_001919 [Tricholoma furcatifolium]|nr:hypothetical protein H0H92_001919 [Tricholoma furcatifolium]